MKSAFFIVGPTAVGKTSLAIELAELFDAEIINADAFQIYHGLDILTAKPDSEIQRQVRHHLLGQVSLAERMSAVRFEELACAALADIHWRNKNAIIAGGSGQECPTQIPETFVDDGLEQLGKSAKVVIHRRR